MLWLLIGAVLRPPALLALGHCSHAYHALLARFIRPLLSINWRRLARDSRRAPLHGRIREAPPGTGWRLIDGPAPPGQGGRRMGPINEHEYLIFRTAVAVWRGHSRRRVDPSLRVVAWPDFPGA